MNETLTTKEYWNQYYTNERDFPIVENLENMSFVELHNTFIKFLPENSNFKFIELGCAPGSWMHYFNKYLKYNVSGIDNTKEAIVVTKTNLDILKVSNNLIEEDIFQFSFNKRFDVVFSAGLVEHFRGEKLDKIIEKHFEAAGNYGYVVFLIPNLSGFNLNYQTILDNNIIKIHNLEIMNIDFFKNISKTKNVEEIFVGYVGKINFGLFVGNKWLLRIGYAIQSLLDKLYFLKLLTLKDSKYFSPYLVGIYRNKE